MARNIKFWEGKDTGFDEKTVEFVNLLSDLQKMVMGGLIKFEEWCEQNLSPEDLGKYEDDLKNIEKKFSSLTDKVYKEVGNAVGEFILLKDKIKSDMEVRKDE